MMRLQYKELAEQLLSGQASMVFDHVEAAGEEQGGVYTAVLYKVHAPSGETYFLVTASSTRDPATDVQYWYIRQHQANYTPDSTQIGADSDHGHAH
jgi:hypothetical protein